MHERLIPNTTRFPDQTIDDETLLFDAETGNLVLLTGFGSAAWAQLSAGVGTAALLTGVESRFGRDASLAVTTFLDDLVAAGILTPSDEPPIAGQPESDWPATFAAPSIERYDDIAKIIAMDPIHDVDATTGWPRIAPDQKA